MPVAAAASETEQALLCQAVGSDPEVLNPHPRSGPNERATLVNRAEPNHRTRNAELLWRLGGLEILRVREGLQRGGSEDPWLCGPGFRRVCLFTSADAYVTSGRLGRQAPNSCKRAAVLLSL
jgi:hypothetical protein